ncbi:MAG: SDR family NAD(P)-dependent oxidoreductase [Pseudomonadota bacterium]
MADNTEAPSANKADDRGRMSARVALVTGATRGIGRAVAKLLAAEGAQTILVARTVGALEEVDDEICKAGGLKPTLVPLDLSELDRIDGIGAALYERYGKLDALVGNAGTLGVLSPIAHIPPKTWEDAFTVNVHANYRLLRSLDPLLRLSDAGRALFVTSGQAEKANAYWSVYAATKAALNALVKSYAEEVAKFGIKANLVSPGPIRTAMRAQAFPGEDPEKLRTPEQIAPAFLPALLPDYETTGGIIDIPRD